MADEDHGRGVLPLAAKMTVLEVAFGTLIERLALQSPNPSENVQTYVREVKRRIEDLSRLPSQQEADWQEAISLCIQNFEEMMRFSFPDQKRDETLN